MDDWTAHRRDDGELLGWIRPEGEEWVAVDVLGRPVSDAVDWLIAEEALESHGLAWLAEPWMLEQDGRPTRVRIVEVTPDHDGIRGRIVVKVDDYGDVSRPASDPIVLPWPLPAVLRPPQPGDPDAFAF
jgi:hypothetical protein